MTRFYSGQQGPPTPVESVQEAEARRQGLPGGLYREIAELKTALSKAEQERDDWKTEALHHNERGNAAEAQVRDLRETVNRIIADIESGDLDSLNRVLRALQATQEDGA